MNTPESLPDKQQLVEYQVNDVTTEIEYPSSPSSLNSGNSTPVDHDAKIPEKKTDNTPVEISPQNSEASTSSSATSFTIDSLLKTPEPHCSQAMKPKMKRGSPTNMPDDSEAIDLSPKSKKIEEEDTYIKVKKKVLLNLCIEECFKKSNALLKPAASPKEHTVKDTPQNNDNEDPTSSNRINKP